MKRINLILAGVALATTLAFSVSLLWAEDGQAGQTRKFEYATLRWAGRDNTHIVRPSGEVEFVSAQLLKLKKPNRADDRSFYLNVLMNALAKEGYEFAGISNDDIVMKRLVAR